MTRERRLQIAAQARAHKAVGDLLMAVAYATLATGNDFIDGENDEYAVWLTHELTAALRTARIMGERDYRRGYEGEPG